MQKLFLFILFVIFSHGLFSQENFETIILSKNNSLSVDTSIDVETTTFNFLSPAQKSMLIRNIIYDFRWNAHYYYGSYMWKMKYSYYYRPYNYYSWYWDIWYYPYYYDYWYWNIDQYWYNRYAYNRYSNNPRLESIRRRLYTEREARFRTERPVRQRTYTRTKTNVRPENTVEYKSYNREERYPRPEKKSNYIVRERKSERKYSPYNQVLRDERPARVREYQNKTVREQNNNRPRYNASQNNGRSSVRNGSTTRSKSSTNKGRRR